MISVAIVDEQRDVREGLQNLLNSAEGFSCVAVFSDGDEDELNPIEVDRLDEESLKCSECGVEIEEDTTICPGCGEEFEDSDDLFGDDE